MKISTCISSLCQVSHLVEHALASSSSQEKIDNKKQVYEKEAIYFLEFIHTVFEKSPFLISAEEAAKVSGCQNDQFTDITVGRMSTHEVCLEVEDEGFEVGWDFKVDGASVSPSTSLQIRGKLSKSGNYIRFLEMYELTDSI